MELLLRCTHVVNLVKEEHSKLDKAKRVAMKAWARNISWAIFTKKSIIITMLDMLVKCWVKWGGINIDG